MDEIEFRYFWNEPFTQTLEILFREQLREDAEKLFALTYREPIEK